MSPIDPTNVTKVQVNAVSDAIRQDSTIPEPHKNILLTIFSIILHLAAPILQLFVGSDGAIDASAAKPAEAVESEEIHPAIAPVAQSLAKAVATVKGQSGANSSVLDKIFAFVLRLLPTVLGLFSHSPASASSAGSTPVAGASAGSQSGVVSGGDGTDTQPGDKVDTGAGAGNVSADPQAN